MAGARLLPVSFRAFAEMSTNSESLLINSEPVCSDLPPLPSVPSVRPAERFRFAIVLIQW